MTNDFKRDIEICKKVGELKALVFLLRTEKKNSLDFELDFIKLEKTIYDIEELMKK